MLTLHFSDTPPTPALYTLSLHDALPISALEVEARLRLPCRRLDHRGSGTVRVGRVVRRQAREIDRQERSEEHTSELQSRRELVCRLLREKKKNSDVVRADVDCGCEWKLG